MKKNIIIAALALVALGGFGYTANLVKNVSTVMLSERGNEILHPGAVGKSYARLASTSGSVVCTGKCLLFDVLITSGVSGNNYVTIADTYTADSVDGLVFKAPFVGPGSRALSMGSNAFPVTFNYGISVDLSSVANGEEVTVIYKDLD